MYAMIQMLQYNNIYQFYQNIQTILLALTQVGIIYYNKGIKYLQEAKRIISISENNIETYRKLKDIYIESMKYAISYLEKAIMQSVASQNVIQCLYLANKHLQRKEAMNQLKQKYSFIKE